MPMFYIFGQFRSARRTLRLQDVSPDGSGRVIREKYLTFTSREAAEEYAANKRKNYPDTTYEVVDKPRD